MRCVTDGTFLVSIIHLFLFAQLWEHKVLATGSLAKDTEEEEEETRGKIAVSRRRSNVPSRSSCRARIFSHKPSLLMQELSTRPAGDVTQGVKRKAESLDSDGVPSESVAIEGEQSTNAFRKHQEGFL